MHERPQAVCTFEEVLQASAKRVVDEYSSIVRRSACCAPLVMLQGETVRSVICQLELSVKREIIL